MAAPAGFDDVAPFVIPWVVADLEETGRVLAWIGDTVKEAEIKIGMPLQVVPQIFDEHEEIKVYFSLEKPGTTWSRGASAR